MTFDKIHLIISIANNKDAKGTLRQIVPHAHTLGLTRFSETSLQCSDPKELTRLARPYAKCRLQVFLDPEAAMEQAISRAGKQDLVLVTGSFYLSGQLRKRWISEEYILQKRKSFRT